MSCPAIPNRSLVALLLDFCVATCLVVFGMQTSLAANPLATHGQPIEDFTLRDFHGQEHSLSDYSDAKVVVVAFLGTECPLAKLYAGRLSDLQEKYRDRSVVVLGIDSNRQDSLKEMEEYVKVHKVNFPLLKDGGNRIADRFAATRTPQVFVLDSLRTIQYQGAIDDQYGIGYQREAPQESYVAEAIVDLLAGRSVRRSQTTPVGCKIGRTPATSSTGKTTYAKHIAPILNQRCVECHREGEVAPFPLTTYEEVLGWGDMMLEVVDQGRMPPWFANPEHGEFKNDARLSQQEKELLRQWVEDGSPEGDPADLPEPPQFAEGWRISQPDEVIYMNKEKQAYHIPAEGVVKYQYFVVDPGWKEDKYVVAAEARPGNRAVVHHIIAYVIPPGQDPRRAHREMLVGYAPGSRPNVMPKGLAMKIAAGSKLLFELHYTPNGSEQDDLSYIGVAFTQREQVKQLMRGGIAINHDFEIPPHAENHEVVAEYRCKSAVRLLRMTPHMHLRGKSFRYEAVYPDDSREVLLDVPAYDFNWQLSYELAEPKLLPKGTRIVCTAHYDNSKNNPANPDPSKAVRWGEQSWEEMMIGFFVGTIEGETLEKETAKRNTGAAEKHVSSDPANQRQTVER